ncbi:MAG: DUF99 family protein [Deltaproteobacteria bacterium]|nr:MAG: DUF99 family protein [Deltaproteobacteria bacterium]
MARRRGIRHVLAFDDAPFPRSHRGDVKVVGTLFSGPRLDGVLWTKVRRDGTNSTRALIEATRRSRFYPQVQAVLLQGITLAGFNVVDLDRLHLALERPVLVVARKAPDLDAIRSALHTRVPGGARKWRLIEAAGPMEPAGRVWVQRRGIELETVRQVLKRFCLYSDVPEPLRVAHIIAGSLSPLGSRRRV